MIALQEELDWQVYRLYGLLEDPLEYDPNDVPDVALGERPFEIALARRVAAGEIETAWFARHGSTPITEIPARWPEPYRRLIERRLKAIEENSWIRLIEQPEYKRRWNREPWEEQEKRALRGWLLDRLEDRRYWPEPRVTSAGRLADRLRQDDEFRQVATLYRGRNDFDWTALVTELVADEGVPYLAAYRYTEAGHRKRAEWEKTWDLQRQEDAIDARTTLPEGDPQRLTADAAKALKASEVGRDRRAAAVRLERLPPGELLAPARQARRAEGALHPLPGTRAGRRPLPRARLGGVEPPRTGAGARHRLQRPPRERGMGPPSASSRSSPAFSSSFPGFCSGTTSPIPPTAANSWARTSRDSSTKRPARSVSAVSSSPSGVLYRQRSAAGSRRAEETLAASEFPRLPRFRAAPPSQKCRT